MLIDFGCGEVEATPCVKTLVIYEQEFGSDMVQDLFGRETVRRTDDSDVLFAFDYRDFEWTAALKALWASVKTADPSTPPFRAWADSLGDVDLMEVVARFIPEVRARLFRPRADTVEGAQGGGQAEG